MTRQPVQSALIRAVGYDLPGSVLELEFVEGGRVYQYFDVPLSVYRELMEADSKGAYFNDFLKDLYPYQEVEETPRAPLDWPEVFAGALPYAAFLDRHATAAQRSRWEAMHGRFRLSAGQSALLGGFVRRMPALCLAGAWCGDCVNQCPAFDHFARAAPALELRFLDRDARPDVREALKINGGMRVPVVVFLSEDGFEVSRYGERTLSIYRKLAADQLGPSCPTGFVPPPDELLAATLSEWLAEFERAQLILRLSPRLRERHGD